LPRIPQRLTPLTATTSAGGAKITKAELASSGASAADLKLLAKQGVDLMQDSAALGALAAKAGPVSAPLGSLDDTVAGKAWRAGTLTVTAHGTGLEQQAVVTLQRALMKVGAHLPAAQAHPELLLMPYGADGSMGAATVAALNTAMTLAGHPELAHQTTASTLGADVAAALESLLAATPKIALPAATGTTGTASTTGTTSTTPAKAPDVFGARAIAVSVTGYDAKWTDALARTAQERPQLTLANAALGPSARYWLQQLDGLQGKSAQYQLNAVNTLVNGWNYVDDTANWGGDHWETPLEFLSRQGDCEDYALTKYESLKRLGFPEEKMRLLIVNDTSEGNARHAVLAVDMPDGTYILDNQAGVALKQQDVKRDDGAMRYTPLFALSRTQRWAYTQPS
jgi:predicted transglutaminase-like cysteine proteinase